MEFDEKIHTHLMSVWRETKSFFGIGGKEGMLILTDNHLILAADLPHLIAYTIVGTATDLEEYLKLTLNTGEDNGEYPEI